MKLEPVPNPPDGIKYALTVPQSVLFADLSLRGSTRYSFHEAMGFDYEPRYIAIDNGAMSWDVSANDPFTELLKDENGAVEGIRYFVETIGSTARNLTKTALVVGPRPMRRRNAADILHDLVQYWHAYELHMTNLFTFWNAEALLSEVAAEKFIDIGMADAVHNGLADYLRPNESNYFSLERRNLQRIAQRFVVTADTGDSAEPSALLDAATAHAAIFGFLLAPFNLGQPPTAAEVVTRLSELAEVKADTKADANAALSSIDEVRYGQLPKAIRSLARLCRYFSFWKTERLDILARADDMVAALYGDAAELLGISLDHLFAMRRSEIEHALTGGSVIDVEEIAERKQGFALVLTESTIAFFAPSSREGRATGRLLDVGEVLEGVGASRGKAKGRVAIVSTTEGLSSLQSGDILVTTMTRPEMGAALDRAAAFVTDEGGLMCHAAIISREMRKPCVIGTADATRVLRDGMIVTVDGDAGTVTAESAE